MMDGKKKEIEVPKHPDLRCREHGSVCEVMHRVYNRLLVVEQRLG